VVALALVAVVHTVAIIGFSLSLALMISSVVAGEGPAMLFSYTLWFIAAVVIRALSLVALDSIAQRGGARIKSQLRRLALSALQKLGPSYMDRASSAEVTTVLSKGIDALDVYFGRYLPQLFLTAIQMPLILLALWVSDIPTGIAVTIALPVIPIFMVLIGWATQAVQKSQWEGMQRLSRGFLDVVEGLSTLKIFGRHWRQVARIRQVTGEFRQKTMGVLRVSFLSSFVLELAASLSVAIVAVSIGIRLIDGVLPLWLGLFVLVLIPELYLPLRNVGAQFHQAADGLAASEELFAIIEATPSDVSGLSASSSEGALLELENVVALREGHPVHEPVSFAIHPGEIVALEGPSGAGKSSLVAALLGFTAYEGVVKTLQPTLPLIEQVAWVPQRPELFQGTISENVSLGQHADSHALTRALTEAGADAHHPDRELGVHGEGLSGGQAQRVALARAYYRLEATGGSIAILDEVTSALDSDTEARVWAGIERLAARGLGVIVISHRSTVNNKATKRVAMTPLMRDQVVA
jgi:ATP-binding cassette subfamily C protein CydD